MPFICNLLTRGNGKLGEGIHVWSLPAVETCPGRTDRGHGDGRTA
jgi:hypothetical protein